MLESRHANGVIFMLRKKSFDLVFILSKVDWVVTSPCSTEIVAPVRETKENDATWATKERDFESQKIVL